MTNDKKSDSSQESTDSKRSEEMMDSNEVESNKAKGEDEVTQCDKSANKETKEGNDEKMQSDEKATQDSSENEKKSEVEEHTIKENKESHDDKAESRDENEKSRDKNEKSCDTDDTQKEDKKEDKTETTVKPKSKAGRKRKVDSKSTSDKKSKSDKKSPCDASADGDGEPAKPLKAIDISEYLADNSESVVLKSEIPDIVKKEPCVLGIDEAGRGPVLGPMVYGTCFCPISKKDEMAALGFDDSKELTEQRREELLDTIIERNDMMAYIVHVLSPHTISTSMLRRHKYNLNALSHDTAIGLIQAALDGGAHIAEVYVDTVGDPGKYQDKLKGIFPNLSITVAKKADSTYPIVSAASICAKVVRDHAVSQWVCAEGIEIPQAGYGSGYPGDDKTKKFLHGCLDPVFGFPRLVRFSWSTAAKILDSKACGVEWEDDEEEDENAKGMSKIGSYFKSSDGPRRHVYFEERHLHTVAGF